MTDDEYRDRYIAHLAGRLEAEEFQSTEAARQIARDLYEQCPRDEMSAEYSDDPKKAANDAFVEWKDEGRNDDDCDDVVDEGFDEEDADDDGDY